MKNNKIITPLVLLAISTPTLEKIQYCKDAESIGEYAICEPANRNPFDQIHEGQLSGSIAPVNDSHS